MAQRVEVIKEKRSWNGKRIMARVGQQGTLCTSCANTQIGTNNISDSSVRVYLDGHKKGIWIKPYYLKLIENN